MRLIAPWILLLSALIAGSAGCGVSVLRLSVDRTSYVPRAPVAIRLHNGSLGRVGYNLCGASLEQETPQGWRPAPGDPGATCLAILYRLLPGETSPRWVYALPHGLAPGRYRLVTRVEVPFGRSWKRLAGAPFVIRPAARRLAGEKGEVHGFSIPTRLVALRTPRGLAVTADAASHRRVEVRADRGLIVGARHELRLIRGGKPTALCGGLGGVVEVGRCLAPRGARPDRVELQMTIFQTDISPRHMWNPAQGPRYRVLWEGVVRLGR